MMKSGYITYSAPVKKIEMAPTELSGKAALIDKIEIKIETEFLFIKFFVNNVFCKDDALALTRDAAELIVSRISFELDCQIGDLWCKGYSLPKKDEDRHVGASSLLVSCNIVGATVKPSIERIQKLKAYLEEPPNDSDKYLPFFRFSINQTDPIARFLFLYNLMLVLNGDKQDAVDDQILIINNKTPITESPIKRDKKETIYTRLRNEVAHCRSNVEQTKTAQEIRQNVSAFQDIVRMSLSLK